MVSAIGQAGRRCVLLGWAGTPVNVFVACDDITGIRTDTPFSVTYINGDPADGSSGAYAHWYVGTQDADSTPAATYAIASNGGTITVSHLGTGLYREVVTGLGNATASGTFQVAKYNGSGFCKVVTWTRAAADLQVDVACRDAVGLLVDSRHTVLFLRKLGPEGFGGGPAAYLWADRLSQDAPYQPATARSWQSNGKRPTIDRTAVGVYTVTLPGLPKGGAALVRAYGANSVSCQLGSIRKTAAPARI